VILAEVEHQLLEHAHAERRRWQDIAALLMQVEREKLWDGHSSSFTAWLEGMARRADLQGSVFWRCLKAGRIYLELTGRETLDRNATISAEALELTDKIRRHAPRSVTESVVERVLEGELSRAELREVWSTYKAASGGATARGRLPTDPELRGEVVDARRAHWEEQKRKPENRAEVRRAELIAGFRTAAWLDRVDQLRCESRTAGLDGQYAALLVLRRDPLAPEKLELHGLWTCASVPELADASFKAQAATDYVWLGVTPDLVERAKAKAPRLLGILTTRPNRALNVVREAQRRSLHAEARLAMLTALLQRAYMWP
jgi:hypothetical protein